MYCDRCDDKVDATLRDEIKDHPDILILLLKRFELNCYYMSYVKIKCFVDVPYTLQISESQTYELYAVVDHFGDLRGGHYTATIKIQKEHENRWYNFDDSNVTLATVFQKYNTERSQTAYLLFYRKKRDLRNLSTNESFLAPPNYNDNCKDAKNKHKREGAGERALVKKEENTGVDDDRQRRPDDDHDFTPEDSIRPAVYDNLNKQDVVKNNEKTNCSPTGADKEEKRKIDFEDNTNGTTGTDKQQTTGMCCDTIQKNKKVGNIKEDSLKDDQRYKREDTQSDHDNILSKQEVSIAHSPHVGVARQTRNMKKGRRGKGGHEKYATKRKALMENLDDSEAVQHKDTKKFCVLWQSTAGKISVTDTTQKDADVEKRSKGQENERDTEQIQIKNSSHRPVRSKKGDRWTENQEGGSDKKTTYRTGNRGDTEAGSGSKKFRTQMTDQVDELRSQAKTEKCRKNPCGNTNESKNIIESLEKTSQSDIKGTETFNKGNTEQKCDITNDSMNTLLTDFESLSLNELMLQEQPKEKNKPKKQIATKMPNFRNMELEVGECAMKKRNRINTALN